MAFSIGTPGSSSATRVMMLGSGELDKAVVIELQRLGVALALADDVDEARRKAIRVAQAVEITL